MWKILKGQNVHYFFKLKYTTNFVIEALLRK